MRRFSCKRVFPPTLLSAAAATANTALRTRITVAEALRRRRATQETNIFYGTKLNPSVPTVPAAATTASSSLSDNFSSSADGDYSNGYALPPLRREQVPSDGSSAPFPPLNNGYDTNRPREVVFLNSHFSGGTGGTDTANYAPYGNEPLGRIVGPFGGEASDSANRSVFDGFSATSLAESLPHDVLYAERADAANILRTQQAFEEQRCEAKESVDAKHNWANPSDYYHARNVRAEVHDERLKSPRGIDASEEIAQRSS